MRCSKGPIKHCRHCSSFRQDHPKRLRKSFQKMASKTAFYSVPTNLILRGLIRNPSVIAVFIALMELKRETGLFLGPTVTLSPGQSVAFRRTDYLKFPMQGGGVAILLFLQF